MLRPGRVLRADEGATGRVSVTEESDDCLSLAGFGARRKPRRSQAGGGVVRVAIRSRADAPSVAVPRPPRMTRNRARRRTARLGRTVSRSLRSGSQVLAPLPHIAEHVVEPERVPGACRGTGRVPGRLCGYCLSGHPPRVPPIPRGFEPLPRCCRCTRRSHRGSAHCSARRGCEVPGRHVAPVVPPRQACSHSASVGRRAARPAPAPRARAEEALAIVPAHLLNRPVGAERTGLEVVRPSRPARACVTGIAEREAVPDLDSRAAGPRRRNGRPRPRRSHEEAPRGIQRMRCTTSPTAKLNREEAEAVLASAAQGTGRPVERAAASLGLPLLLRAGRRRRAPVSQECTPRPGLRT